MRTHVYQRDDNRLTLTLICSFSTIFSRAISEALSTASHMPIPRTIVPRTYERNRYINECIKIKKNIINYLNEPVNCVGI